jgi:hypothetical protein
VQNPNLAVANIMNRHNTSLAQATVTYSYKMAVLNP